MIIIHKILSLQHAVRGKVTIIILLCDQSSENGSKSHIFITAT